MEWIVILVLFSLGLACFYFYTALMAKVEDLEGNIEDLKELRSQHWKLASEVNSNLQMLTDYLKADVRHYPEAVKIVKRGKKNEC